MNKLRNAINALRNFHNTNGVFIFKMLLLFITAILSIYAYATNNPAYKYLSNWVIYSISFPLIVFSEIIYCLISRNSFVIFGRYTTLTVVVFFSTLGVLIFGGLHLQTALIYTPVIAFVIHELIYREKDNSQQ